MIFYILLFGLALTSALQGGILKQPRSQSDTIKHVRFEDPTYNNEPQPIGQQQRTSRFVPTLLINQPQVPSGQNTSLDILRNQIAEQSVIPQSYGTEIPPQQIIYQRNGNSVNQIAPGHFQLSPAITEDDDLLIELQKDNLDTKEWVHGYAGVNRISKPSKARNKFQNNVDKKYNRSPK